MHPLPAQITVHLAAHPTLRTRDCRPPRRHAMLTTSRRCRGGYGRRMDTLTWDEAKPQVEAVDSRLAAAFDAVYRDAPIERRQHLTVAHARYPYGADVIRGGTPKDDHGDDMPEQLTLPTRLPVGLITHNGMEVMETVVSRVAGGRSLETRLIPQALLGRRRLIGVFELLDWKTTGSLTERADWNISAGSRTIFTTERYNTIGVAKAVRNTFGVDPPETATLFDWLAEIPVFKTEVQRAWRADILYFAAAWFEDDVRLDAMTEKGPPSARELYHAMLERAWPTISRLRPNSGVLYDVLREADDRNIPDVIEAAFRLLEHWSAIRRGLRPCFVPTDMDDELGPFGTIIKRFVNPVLDCDSILRPTYLSSMQPVGYLKLSHIAPVLFASQIEKNLDLTMRLIRNAAAKAIEVHNNTAEHALGWPAMFRELTFRHPPGKAEEKAPRVVRFKPPNHAVAARRPAYDREDITETEFFSCYRNQLPRQRCEFFTGSFRIIADNA